MTALTYIFYSTYTCIYTYSFKFRLQNKTVWTNISQPMKNESIKVSRLLMFHWEIPWRNNIHTKLMKWILSILWNVEYLLQTFCSHQPWWERTRSRDWMKLLHESQMQVIWEHCSSWCTMRIFCEDMEEDLQKWHAIIREFVIFMQWWMKYINQVLE